MTHGSLAGAPSILQIAAGNRWTRVTEKPAASRAAPALPGLPGAHRTALPTTTVTPEEVEGHAAACAVAGAATAAPARTTVAAASRTVRWRREVTGERHPRGARRRAGRHRGAWRA